MFSQNLKFCEFWPPEKYIRTLGFRVSKSRKYQKIPPIIYIDNSLKNKKTRSITLLGVLIPRKST